MNLIIAILSSSSLIAAVVSIVSLFLNRKWTKEDREANKQTEIVTKLNRVESGLEKHIEDNDLSDALQARRRIIAFADECRRKIKHSEEHFENVAEDIDDYVHYCDTHPGFKNNKASLSIAFVLDCYDQARRNNDFI